MLWVAVWALLYLELVSEGGRRSDVVDEGWCGTLISAILVGSLTPTTPSAHRNIEESDVTSTAASYLVRAGRNIQRKMRNPRLTIYKGVRR
jgi:hypothetical protein